MFYAALFLIIPSAASVPITAPTAIPKNVLLFAPVLIPFQISPAEPNRPPPTTAPPAILPANFLASSLLPTGCPVSKAMFSSAVLLSANPNVNVWRNP